MQMNKRIVIDFSQFMYDASHCLWGAGSYETNVTRNKMWILYKIISLVTCPYLTKSLRCIVTRSITLLNTQNIMETRLA